ncbi:methionine--tRNA ligase [Alienimonas californiensis]|uniref:Methionine--tRNA ligase n=1 Tax=Alienimonas californiensis TaxID=2527989 RepID=A0A517P934_9PLAN|nr:methionine--tRNA ligase [Alienimonas californiensis]QDT15875.1 Methionine--tRNA ligase [Alienimonas californiensis]
MAAAETAPSSSSSARRILVTSALPYANGPIHIGHLVEYLQTDIWVRFQRMRGHRTVYVCADDTHGTSVMISARRAGVTEEAFIARVREEHLADFAAFGVEFDHYGSTNSEANRTLCERVWGALTAAGRVEERTVSQLYDPTEGTFLADRFVKGTCPNCKSPEQLGDSCEVCGAAFEPTDLIDPISTLSGTTPELREASHLFVTIEPLHDFLRGFVDGGAVPPEVANYLKGQFLGDASDPKELRDWDVSRPAAYFGFEIPGHPGQYWFVWFDAPIGYAASTLEWCETHGENFDDWWSADASSELHHFIGRDITYFHCLFWPAMLKTAGLKLPDRVHVHGFLTIDGQKMSKRRWTLIKAANYAKHLDPSYLRYYFATKLTPRWDDFDLNLTDFADRVDSDLVNTIVNLASRTARFAKPTGLSETYPDDGGLFAAGAAKADRLAEFYEAGDFAAVTREVLALATAANGYVERAEPWAMNKDPARAQELQDVCTVALNLFRQVVVYLAPVLPELAAKTEELLNCECSSWEAATVPLTGTPVSKFKHMLTRVDRAKVSQMVEESKAEHAEAETADAPAAGGGRDYIAEEPLADECTIEDFLKIDLRVAEVLESEAVEGADKLLKLKLGLGGGHTRQVFAGMKKVYSPESLLGRKVICCANLKPRKMRFGVSEGMVLAAGAGEPDIYILAADDGAQPGMRVH